MRTSPEEAPAAPVVAAAVAASAAVSGWSAVVAAAVAVVVAAVAVEVEVCVACQTEVLGSGTLWGKAMETFCLEYHSQE